MQKTKARKVVNIELFIVEKKINTHDSRTQSSITCSKLTIEILEQAVKYVQS